MGGLCYWSLGCMQIYHNSKRKYECETTIFKNCIDIHNLNSVNFERDLRPYLKPSVPSIVFNLLQLKLWIVQNVTKLEG